MLPVYERMEEIFTSEGLKFSPDLYKKFDIYADLLLEWNNKINLTAITDPEEVAVKHFLDSILPIKLVNVPHGALVVDIGTGAGFPGIPMKLYRPDLRITLVDSLNKRIRFLSEACAALNIEADCVHGRAEELGHDLRYREKFDIAVARAVAPLSVLTEYCLPFVKEGGYFFAMKGPNEEIHNGENAIKVLGGEIAEVMEYSLQGGERRVLIIVKKICLTGKKYPRNSGQITKKPL